MLIRVDPNEFCPEVVAHFREVGPPRPVTRVKATLSGGGPLAWCTVTGLGPAGGSPAHAVPVEDSGGGVMLLVYGGAWGLRLVPEAGGDPWNESYLLRASEAVA